MQKTGQRDGELRRAIARVRLVGICPWTLWPVHRLTLKRAEQSSARKLNDREFHQVKLWTQRHSERHARNMHRDAQHSDAHVWPVGTR